MPAPWQDPELVARGREPMHAIRRAPALLLDGTWRFQLLPAPDAEPGPDWREIAVPGCWTMQGTADRPQYTNVQMPFPGEPPHVPAANPTGVYERDFDLPTEWHGQRVVLHVGAAESVVIVELNGRRVGVGKDSHLASEFDVSGSRRGRPERAAPDRREVVRRHLHRGPGPVVARRPDALGLPVRHTAAVPR